MKKHLIKLLLLSTLTLAGCSGNSSVSSPDSTGSDSSTTSSTTETQYPAATVTSSSTTYSVEKKQSVTIRVTVTTEASSKLANFTLVEGEGIIEYDETATNNVATIKVTGKKKGTAVLRAAAVANPNATLDITINVTSAIGAASKVWEKVIEKTNYTINVTRTPTEAEVDDKGWDEEEAVPYARIRATDKAIVREVATSVADNLTPTWGADSTLTQEGTDNSGNAVKIEQFGFGIDKNGYAITLAKNNGTLMNSSELSVIKTDAGLLTKDSFLGLGENATSPNDVGTFFGLQAVNPDWLPSTKDKSNVYSLDGDEDTTETEAAYYAYAESLLWELVDFASFYQTVSSGVSSYADIANYVSASITTLSSDSISFEVVVTNGNTYTATISDVGSTTIESEYTTYLTTAAGTKPSLTSGIQAFKTAIEGHNYVLTSKYPVGSNSTTILTYDTYYTENYMMIYYDKDFVEGYNSANPSNTLTVGGSVLAKFSDGIHYLEYTPAATEGGTGTVEDKGLAFTISTVDMDLWDINFSGTSFTTYIESSDFIVNDYLYNLSTSSESIFTSYPSVFWTQNDSVAEKFYEWWAGDSMSTQYLNSSKLFGLHVDTTTVTEDGQSVVKATSASFILAIEQTKGTGSYGIYYTPEFSAFGEANNNDADTLIKNEISSYTTTA